MNEEIGIERMGMFGLGSYDLRTQFDECISKLADEGDGLSLGFPEMEEVLDSRGFQGGQLVTIIAKPKVGKTFFVCNSIRHLMIKGKRVLFISIEMNSSAIIRRLLRLELMCGYDRIKQYAVLEPEKLADIGNRWWQKLVLLDMKDIDLAMITNIVKTFNPDVVFVDYLQLVGEKSAVSEMEKVSKVAKGLADIAQTQDKIVVALSQTAKDDRPGWEMPSSSSGKWSSDIHIASDILIGMCRPDTNPDCAFGDKKKIIMQILESRYGGSSLAIPYYYDSLTTELIHYDRAIAQGIVDGKD